MGLVRFFPWGYSFPEGPSSSEISFDETRRKHFSTTFVGIEEQVYCSGIQNHVHRRQPRFTEAF